MDSRNIQEWFKIAFRLLVSEKWDVIAERVESGDPTYRWLREILITQLKSIQRDNWETWVATAAFHIVQRLEGLTGAIISEEEFLKHQYWLKDITGLFAFQPDIARRLTAAQKVLAGRLALLQNFLTNDDNPTKAGGVVCRIFDKVTDVDEVVNAIYEKTDPKLAYDAKEMYDLTKEYAEKMKIPLDDLVELEFEPDCLPTEPAAEPYIPPETWVFGCYGEKEGQFSSPEKVQIDKEGNYLVMDLDLIAGSPGIVVHQRLQLFDPLGKLIKVILKRGEGKVNDMKDFCLDKSGNIIVADLDDEGRARIQVFDYDGKRLMVINVEGIDPDTFSRVLTVSIDEDDNIIAADMGNKCVWVYGPDGKVKSRFGEFGKHDGGFMDIRSAYAKGKEIYAFDNGSPFEGVPLTKVFDYDGNFIKSIWNDYTYSQIVFHTDGHIYTVQSEEIHRIDLEGNREVVAKKVEHDDELGALRFITSMTFHPDGRMVVSENSNHRVKVFKVKGESP